MTDDLKAAAELVISGTPWGQLPDYPRIMDAAEKLARAYLAGRSEDDGPVLTLELARAIVPGDSGGPDVKVTDGTMRVWIHATMQWVHLPHGIKEQAFRRLIAALNGE